MKVLYLTPGGLADVREYAQSKTVNRKKSAEVIVDRETSLHRKDKAEGLTRLKD